MTVRLPSLDVEHVGDHAAGVLFDQRRQPGAIVDVHLRKARQVADAHHGHLAPLADRAHHLGADAEYIVFTANFHAELLAALVHLCDASPVAAALPVDDAKPFSEAYAAARAAIAKATQHTPNPGA